MIISGCTSVHPYKFGWEFEFVGVFEDGSLGGVGIGRGVEGSEFANEGEAVADGDYGGFYTGVAGHGVVETLYAEGLRVA